MLRGALIGLGNVALDGHVPGWLASPDVALVAVTDVDDGRRAEAARRLPAARWFDSVDRLLDADGLDFVDICTPPASHAPLIERALQRGLHVLCEKPLVRSPAELATVTRLAAAGGRVLHTVHNWHHAPIVKRTSVLLGDGAIGRVARVVWHTLRMAPAATRNGHAANWRLDPAIAGGGILTDHGWHVFYVVQRWVGLRPAAISARLEKRRHAALAVEDTASVTLTFPGGPTAEILLTWAAEERRNWAQLTGADGALELRDDTLVLARGGRTERWACPPAMSNGSTHPDWFVPVAAGFVDAVGGVADAVNLAEASLCVVLEHLARESSRCGGQVLTVPAAPVTSESPV